MESTLRAKVVIGTWPLSGDLGHVHLRDVAATLEECAKLGYREFDVAPNYGRGFMESCLGNVFRGDASVRINTKCGNLPFNGKKFDVSELRKSLEQSLVRLARDHVQTLFLHNPRQEIGDYSEHMAFFDAMKAEGRIRYSGLSAAKGFTYDDGVIEGFDALQDDGNLLYLEAIRNRPRPKHAFHVRSPLATGILSGRLTPETQFEAGDYRAGWLKGARLEAILRRVKSIQKLSSAPLRSLARSYLLVHPKVDRVIFGVKKPEHVQELHRDVISPTVDQRLCEALTDLYDKDFGVSGADRDLRY